MPKQGRRSAALQADQHCLFGCLDSIFFLVLDPKFQASTKFLWLHELVCDRFGRKLQTCLLVMSSYTYDHDLGQHCW